MDHKNPQVEKFKVFKDYRFPIEIGMDLENPQPKRPKVFKDLFLTKYVYVGELLPLFWYVSY